ncbi:MAG: DNA alkylation repair protein [Acidobacteria bacterium]|nr:DNA alkylation repair protein [Acidobacteriota bacterium]
MSLHPSQRFEAPAGITAGVPLKDMMGRKLVSLIAESLAELIPAFDARRFTKQATQGLANFELMDRAQRIADAMAAQLPSGFDDAAPILVQSFGPTRTNALREGLATFYYLPHSQYIATYGVSRFDSGMNANYELTKRFTAEFSIRPFLIQHRDACLAMLRNWTRDPDQHVRRLVSEGTRPRLPWAMRLLEFQANPHLSLPLLEALKDDPELYVRRSVANHLGDIAKDHPALVFDVCEAWLNETPSENRRWMIRHAVRHPAKKNHPRALAIRRQSRAQQSDERD